MKSTVLDIVVERLTNYITSSSLEAGEKLPAETKLAKDFGVGRPTMREACRILESRGYVKRIPGRGIFLASKDAQEPEGAELTWFKENRFELEEVFHVRLCLESLAIKEVIEKNTYPSIIEKLSENYSSFATEKFSPDDAEMYTRLDEEFHQMIVVASGNELLKDIFTLIMAPVLRNMRTVSFRSEINWRNACRAHLRIITAMKKDNSYSIKDSLEDHIRQTRALFYLGDEEAY